jgi:Piwi domain
MSLTSAPVARSFDRSTPPVRRAMVLNALPVTFSAGTVLAWVRPFDPDEDLSAFRRSVTGHWDYRRRGDELFLFRLDESAPPPPGDAIELQVGENLGLIAGLLPGALAARLPLYRPLRYRPFRFRALKRNLVTDAVTGARLQHHPILDRLVVAPRYDLDGRVLEITDGEPQVVITVDMSTDWRIDGTLAELGQDGIPVAGHYAVWAEERRVGRRLAGEIIEIAGDMATVQVSDTEQTQIACDELRLEPSRHTIIDILNATIGRPTRALLNSVDEQVGELLGGPSLLEQVKYVHSVIKQESLAVVGGLTCTVGEPIHLGQGLEVVTQGRPVRYCFDAARTKQDEYAWRGLEQYGPFSGDTFAKRSPTIMVVHPAAAKGQVETFIQALRDGVQGPGLRGYIKGFARTFALSNPRFTFASVPSSGAPAEAYRRTVDDALAAATAVPDAAIVVIRDEDALLPDDRSPYLFAKAALLMGGVPVQEIRLSTATREPVGLQYVLQNVGVALYAKMNGIPWTVDHDLTIADEIVIGIGTAEMTKSRFTARQRVVGVTTVFRGDGNYLLGHLSRECSYAEYPEVLRQSTTEVLKEIKIRNGWQPGDIVRVVVHSPRPPRDVDAAKVIADALAAVGSEQEVEFAFVQVSHDHPFILFDERERGYRAGPLLKGIMAPARGTIIQTTGRSRLLSTVGPQLVKRAGLPLPRPLQIHLHRASTFTDMVYLTEQVLKFTSLTWRSTMPAAEPVSIYYSELIAHLLARLRHVPGWSPATLSSRLRTSRWFL